MKRFLISVFFSLALLAGLTFASEGWLEIYCVNVGQGDATLIVGPHDTTVLVDSGRTADATQNILDLLTALEITHLDYTIATHYDQDHIASFCDVFSKIGQPEIAAYDRGGDRRSSATSAQPTFFTEYIACTGAKRARINAGDVIDLGGGATMSVLAVGDPDYMGGAGTSDYTELYDGSRIECANHENEKSISLLITYGGFDFLLSGDLTGINDPPIDCSSDGLNVEMPIGHLITGEPLHRDVDVFHLNHHGSETTGNRSDFVKLIAPEVGIISVGNSASCGPGFNTYGHPGQLVLDALFASDVKKIYQTEEGGCQWVNDPSPCTPAPGEKCPRDYHGIPHEFLYDQHVAILTDGQTYKIKSTSGDWDLYTVDEPPNDDDSDDDSPDDDADDDLTDDDSSDDDSSDDEDQSSVKRSESQSRCGCGAAN